MELLDIYDADGQATGLVCERGKPLVKGQYHLAAEIWIMDARGRFLIQRRSKEKRILPDIWAMTTGLMISGETSLKGCIRETEEEMGIKLSAERVRFIRRIVRTDMIWDVYLAFHDCDINDLKLQEEEVSEAKWADIDTLKKMLMEGTFYKYPEIYEIIEEIQKEL